ncbi:hypothetical protein D3C71_1643130 [compost metagenome]
MVSPHSTRWLSSPCRNMFILASAHVLPMASWPKSAYLRDPVRSRMRRPHFMSNEPEPQVGSQISSPGCGSIKRAIRLETSGGV